MTINSALAECSRVLGDTVPEEIIMGWLSEIEHTLISELSDTHENPPSPVGDGRERELFVPDPQSKLYVDYAVMMNDLRLRDMQRYINSAAIFSAAYSAFADSYNRSHFPVGQTEIVI